MNYEFFHVNYSPSLCVPDLYCYVIKYKGWPGSLIERLYVIGQYDWHCND